MSFNDNNSIESSEWQDFCKSPVPKPILSLNNDPHAQLNKTSNGLIDIPMDFDPRNLKPRDWVASGYFLKRHVTIVAGAGGVGKSLYTINCAVALALGESLGKMQSTGAKNVLMYGLEDSKDELQARISAALHARRKRLSDLKDKLSIVTISEEAHDVDGKLFTITGNKDLKVTSSYNELIERLDGRMGTSRQVDVLILDPYVELQNGDENDNNIQAAVLGRFKQIARKYNCSVVIVHHSRKDAEGNKSSSAIRGASSIVNAVRTALIVTTMTTDEMGKYDIKTNEERESYFSVRKSKNNYAPNGSSEWFKKETVLLPQDSGEVFEYPYVKAIYLNEVTIEATPRFNEFIARVKEGINGQPYSTAHNATKTNLDSLLKEFSYENRRKQVEETLISRGFREAIFKNKSRTTQKGWRSPDGRPDNVDWVISS